MSTLTTNETCGRPHNFQNFHFRAKFGATQFNDVVHHSFASSFLTPSSRSIMPSSEVSPSRAQLEALLVKCGVAADDLNRIMKKALAEGITPLNLQYLTEDQLKNTLGLKLGPAKEVLAFYATRRKTTGTHKPKKASKPLFPSDKFRRVAATRLVGKFVKNA
jgi:hypothetical protein